MKKIIAQFLPLGLINLYYFFIKKRTQTENKYKLELNIELANKNFNQFDNKNVEDVYNNSISYLLKKGINPSDLFGGSMPLESIKEIDIFLKNNIVSKSSNEPLIALHIGNFVGVSLNCFTFTICNQNKNNSRVISIDPNINHRGIENPAKFVSELLSLNNLEDSSVMITGYSHEKSLSNDGNIFHDAYDPLLNLNNEYAPTNVINSISLFLKKKISVVLIDGNHDVSYVIKELNFIKKLLAEDAIIILDDIDEKNWKELFDLYNNLSNDEFEKQFSNGRIGILKYKK
jgi:hypothetical protein